MPKNAEPEQVPSITGAPVALTDDSHSRFVRYAWSMGIRTASFIAFCVIDHWTRWLFLPAGLLIPYIAVVIANAGREGSSVPTTHVSTSPAEPLAAAVHRELGTGKDVIDGEIITPATPQTAPTTATRNDR
ncbi:DUF3099 domain-containing protein [Micrococcales bacterium 31B]|nr:DUF3099 domain-containing protein [Micrococcales bacterium 31B]